MGGGASERRPFNQSSGEDAELLQKITVRMSGICQTKRWFVVSRGLARGSDMRFYISQPCRDFDPDAQRGLPLHSTTRETGYNIDDDIGAAG